MSGSSQQLNNLGEFAQAAQDCYSRVIRLATAIEVLLANGVNTGFNATELAALGQLKRAANALSDGLTITAIAADVLDGNFGQASDEAQKFILGQLIEKGLGDILFKLGNLDNPGILSSADLEIYNSINGTFANIAASGLADFAVQASRAFTQALETAVRSKIDAAELIKISIADAALTDIANRIDQQRRLGDYDDLGLSSDFILARVGWNIVYYAAGVVRQDDPFNLYALFFGVDRTGVRNKIDTIIDFRSSHVVIDMTKGASTIGAAWTLDESIQQYGQAYINRLPTEDFTFKGEATGLLNSNMGGVRSLALADGGRFADMNASGGASFMLSGNGGNQRGSSSNDIMLGGSTALGGRGNDLIVLDNDQGSFAAGESGDDVIFGSSKNDKLVGNAGDDLIEGGRGNDEIEGGSGDDTVLSGDGDDTIDGGSGDDSLEGGKGNDTIKGGSGDDTIRGSELTPLTDGDNSLSGDGGDDSVYGGDGKDTMDGGAGDDTLVGNGGADDIKGGAGADKLYGGKEDGSNDGAGDTLSGGAGSDSYFVNDGDKIVNDKDGTVTFNGIELKGGEFKPEDPGCEPDNDNEEDEEKEYEGPNGEKYKKGDNGLTVTHNGATLTIEGWSDGDLGITLEDKDPGDGSECDPPPDNFGSPLVLDLDGDGVELVSLEQSITFFDIDRDGVRERTGWVAGDDGLLALDRDFSGAIESAAELFGYGETFSARQGQAPDAGRLGTPDGLDIRFDSGFAQLSALDFNNDLVIDILDPEFGTLLVWQDENRDGISQSRELFSLTDVGIASISLDALAVEGTRDGHLITDESILTTTGGETREVLDVWFQFDQYDTQFIEPEGLDPTLDLLPDLRAAGQVKPLKLAMAENAELRGLVEQLTTLTIDDLGSVSSLVNDILYSWAGLGSPDRATGRGVYADRRAVEVMEAFSDTPFAQWSGPIPRPQAGAFLTDQFQSLSQAVAGKLVAQTALGQSLFPEFSFENGQFLVLADGTLSTTVLQRLIDNAPAEINAALAHFQAGLRILDLVYKSFDDVAAAGDDGASYVANVESILQAAGIDLGYTEVLTARIGGDGDDSFLTESFSGFQFGFKTPVVSGGLGDDDITLGGNQQIIYWGAGQGNDTVRLDPFASQGWNFTPRVEIRLIGVESAADISFSRAGSSLGADGAIVIDATGETLTIRNLLGGQADPSGILVFDDGSVVTFADLADDIALLAETGTDADEVLIQRLGLTLDGGAGDDVLRGADGDTSYVFGFGSGRDRIEDSAVGNNIVNFGPGVTLADLAFDRVNFLGSTLIITIPATGDRLEVRGQFADDGPVIGNFVFETDPPLSAQDIADLFLVDDVGDNRILGTSADEIFGIGGSPGNDEKSGFNGSDLYLFGLGDGNDVIDDRGSDNGVDVVEIDFDFAELTSSIDFGDFVFLHAPSGDQLRVEGGIEQFNFNDRFNISPNDVAALIALGPDPDAVLGSGNDETFTGTPGRDFIAALGGNDSISALGDADRLLGGDGNDNIDAGDGDDVIEAGDGNDTALGGQGNDSIDGGQGADDLRGGDGDDIIFAGDQSGVSQRENNTVDGGAGNDTIDGGWEDDLLQGGSGNDIIRGEFGADTIIGGTGNDIMIDRDGATTYLYELGDGDDQIFDDGSSFNTDEIVFGAGIAQADLSFTFAQVDVTPFTNLFFFEKDQWAIQASIASGGSVTFTGSQFDAVGSIDRLRFDDGSTLSLSAIEAILRTPTDADQLIVGRTGFSDDTLGGGGGNDTLIGNFGDTTFLFGLGDGQDLIIAPEAGDFDNTTLRLGPGILPGDITITRGGEGDGDLIVTLSTGDSITVQGQYQTVQDLQAGAGVIASSYVDQITFTDDPAATLDAAAIRAIPLAESAGNDVQIGSNVDDVFAASAGDDQMRGRRGSDTYSFGIDSGNDLIVEVADDLLYAPDSFEFEGGPFDIASLRESDTVTFGPGIAVGDLTLTRTGTSLTDLRIDINGTADSLLIQNQLFPEGSYGRATKEFDPFGFGGPFGPVGSFALPVGPLAMTGPEIPTLGPNGEISQEYWNFFAADLHGPDPLFQNGIEFFVFDDGTTFTRDEFAALINVVEDDGDQTVRTDDLGGTLDGGAGNDTLLGGAGNDTYIVNIGSGNDLAVDGGGDDTVQLGADISPELVAFSRVGENGDDLLVEVGGEERSAVYIEGQFANDGREIELFRTDDGAEFTAEQIRGILLDEASTEGNDVIVGFETDDLIDARDGDDLIEARGGNNIVDGGEGRDTAQFRGSASEYQIVTEGPWTIVTDLTGRDGESRLINVEALNFLGGDGGAPELQELVANQAPTAGPVSVSGREDTPLILVPATLLAAASDADGASVALVSVGNADNGSVEIDTAGRVVFAPNLDFNGAASFEYTIADSGGLQATGMVSVTVDPVNDAPLATSDTASGDEDKVIVIAAVDLFSNDDDVDGDALSIIGVNAEEGSVEIDTNGDVAFTPDANFNGAVLLTYTISDGLDTSTAEIELAVLPVNDAPAAENDTSGGFEDAPILILADDLLSNDGDVDGDALALASVGSASNGTAVLDVDGNVVFTPDADFNGVAGFEYTLADPGGLTATASVTLTVAPGNDAPVARDDAGFSTGRDAPVTILASDVLDNDSDLDGDQLSIVNIDTVVNGSAVLDASGDVIFTPDAGFEGEATFVYVVSDPGAEEAIATVTVDVVAINNPPQVATPLSDAAFDEDSPVSLPIPAGTFADVDGDTLTLTAALVGGGALPVWLAFDGTAFTGTPPPDFNGDLDIEVTASDGEFSVASAFVLSITPVNDAPVALDDSGFVVDAGQTVTIAAADLLANDSDVDGDALTLASVTDRTGGTVSLDSDGDVTFVADASFDGFATFGYVVSDGAGGSDSATVSVEVTGGADPYEGFVRGTEGPDCLFGHLFQPNQIFGAGGDDKIIGGFKDDHLAGGEGSDLLIGFFGDDSLDGNQGNDKLIGGHGRDVLTGGKGDDWLLGGRGNDTFVFSDGDGSDLIWDFEEARPSWWWWHGPRDTLALDFDGVDTAADALALAEQVGRDVIFDFGDGDMLQLSRTWLHRITEDQIEIL